MADAPTTFGPKAVDQIAKTVREVSRRLMNETPHRGRWQQRQPSGILISAIARACSGNGWYEFEVAEDFTGEPELSGDSYGGNDCELCSIAIIDSTVGGACEDTTAVDVDRALPTGTGEYVYALDVEYLPLDVPSHCFIMPLRYSETYGQLYAVVRGPHPLIKQPKGDWECCGATVVQTECSYDIVEGVHCPGWVQDCPS